jgi:chromosome segregation ATPase
MAEDEKTKDLLIKLQILTNGLIEERKKSQSYLDRIKELEKILQTKDNEIVSLSKAKFDLQADLTFERSKRDSKQGSKKFSKEMQIEQYEEIINEQGYKLRNINNQLINERENFEQQKTDFQTIIKAQTAKMEELKQLLEKERKENTDLRKKQYDIDLMLKEYEEDKVQYTEQFARYQNDKIETQKKNLELQETIDKLRKESFEKEKQINDLVKNSEKLANQLNDMKSAIVNKQLTKKSFTVEMMGKGKKIIEIIFQKKQDSDSDKDEYEMSIINKSKNEIIEVINLLDISGFQINEKDKNRVDISYTVS